MECLTRQDLAGLTGVMADVCPIDDDADHENVEEYPLPAEHWINVPLGKEGDYKSLLHLGLESGNPDIGNCIFLLVKHYKFFTNYFSSPPHNCWSQSRPTQ